MNRTSDIPTRESHLSSRRRARSLGLAVLVALGATAAAPTARADDWGTPGLDAAHGRLSLERSGALFADGRWKTTFAGGARVLASPVVADGIAVTVDLAGAIHGLGAEDGQPLWAAPAGSAVQGTPAVTHGRVFVPTFANKLVALGLGDGAPLWTHDLGGTMLSSPTAVNGDVVVAAGFPQRHIVRLAGATGEVVWQSPEVMEQFSNTSPAVGGGLVVVGSNGGHYYAFDLVTGALRWSFAADGIVHLAAPLIAGGRVYLAGGGDSAHVYALDAATGAVAPGWPIDLPTPDPDVAGTRIGRQRAVSSFASVAGLVLLETRLDDALDTNADGAVDETLSREIVVALDPGSGALAWQFPVARAELTDPNDVPTFFVCPTPAAYGTVSGAPLVAVASSLDPSVTVLDAASGGERARHAVAGAALASPVVANGRLITIAINGAVEGLLSSVNHPPSAPIPAANARPLDSADLILRWLPGTDPDGELPSYELRIDADGEVLTTWQQQIFLGAGVTSTQITSPLAPDVSYSFAVRARDSHGAYSSWSALGGFKVATNPPVTVNGKPASSLGAALGAAQPGDLVVLGAGVYTLSQTLHVGAGVSIQGAGAGRTTLDGTGLPIGVSFDGPAGSQGAGLDGVAVAGADTCVQVGDGSTGIRLSHVILRDCRTTGVAVAATGGATIVNATMARNGTAVEAKGPTTVKNSLLVNNGVGLSAAASGALTNSYDGLFGNQTPYQGLASGTGDISATVTFADLTGNDFRLLSTQPSTDKGDPGDPVGAEPVPNGSRINLGAFGGTPDAETSSTSTAVGGSGSTPDPTPGSTSPGETEGGGCAVGARGAPGGLVPLMFASVAALLARRRKGRPDA